MTQINLYLGKQLKEDWLSYCDRLGIKPGAAIRQSIEKQIQNNTENEKTFFQAESHDDSEKIRIVLRVTQSEYDAIQQMKEKYNTSAQRYLINIIRQHLTKEPQLSMSEIEAVWSSNRELNAIGKNINQIAKQLNAMNVGQITSKEISVLSEKIDSHIKKVNQLISRSIDRTTIKEIK